MTRLADNAVSAADDASGDSSWPPHPLLCSDVTYSAGLQTIVVRGAGRATGRDLDSALFEHKDADLNRLLGLTVEADEEGETDVVLTGQITTVASHAKVLTLRGCMFGADTLRSAWRWQTNTLALHDKIPQAGLASLASFSGLRRLKLDKVGRIPSGELCRVLKFMARLEEITIISPRTRGWTCFDLCSALVRSSAIFVHLELGEVDRTTHSRCLGAIGCMYLREQFVSFSGVL